MRGLLEGLARILSQTVRYIATDFHVDRTSSVFENQLQSWSTDFGFLPAFRNCRSVRSNFTAQAHLCFPLSEDPVNRETSQGKKGKRPHMSWKTKMWWPKKSKISFHRVCEWVAKRQPLTILSPLVRILVISRRADASRSTKIVLQDFIQIRCEGLAFT